MGFQLVAREIERVVVVEAVGRLTLTDGHTQLRDLIHVSTGDGARKFVINLARVNLSIVMGLGSWPDVSVVRRAGRDEFGGGMTKCWRS